MSAATDAILSQRADRFLFYSHDALGLGHVRRNLLVASALTDLAPKASVLVATSSEEAERFGVPAGVDLLKIPGLRKAGNERYEARKLQLRWPEIRDIRTEILAAAVTSFRPSVLLVDKHPLGVGGELRPALEAARARGARAVLGVRDVLDELRAVDAEWRDRGLFGEIHLLYDRVLIYGQSDVFDPLREYHFPEEVAAMSSFCGYVVPRTLTARHAKSPVHARGSEPLPRVLATAGGGEDGFELLTTFVEAAADARWQAVVISGAHCPPAHARKLERLAGEAGLDYRGFLPGLSAQFRSLDALVCMGGYNTLAEAAASGVSTVCVPRVQPRTEQLIRAHAFEDRGLLKVLEPNDLDPAALRAEVESALVRPVREKQRVRELDLDGARRAARHLLAVAVNAMGARTAAEGGRP